MRPEIALIAVSALLISAWLTYVIRKLALSHGLIDTPNERSSHVVPTPRGGGAAIVMVATIAFVVLALLDLLELDVVMALVGGGIVVAVVGLLDDRYKLRAGVRLAVHFAAALWALVWLGGVPPIRIAGSTLELGWLGYVLGVLGITWTLNLFNFMDGIDGIATAEATFVSFAGAALTVVGGYSGTLAGASVVFGASCCGFLAWNWPPAKVFMGDIGSGFIGYTIAVLAIAAAHENPIALLVWVILGGVFFVDATVTLGRRLSRGEHVHEAHRSHAYQRLARRWRSHRRVTMTAAFVNMVWLFPCALAATLYPRAAGWMVVLALLPVAVGAIVAGAGQPESTAN